MRRIDLQRLSERKIESALALARLKHWSNAYYLAGYSVEMALKAVITKQISADTLPDRNLINKVYTHNFKELLGLAGLKRAHDEAIAGDSLLGERLINGFGCAEMSA